MHRPVDSVTLAANVVLFQAGWFACVLGAAHGLPWIGVTVAAIVVAWHVARAARPAIELRLVGTTAAVGALFETALVRSGWISFPGGMLVDGIAPYWMVAMWALFATTLNVSLRWLRPHGWLAALLGALGGPAAYYAGTRLGALEFIVAGAAVAAIALGWAALTPLLLRVARQLDGYARP